MPFSQATLDFLFANRLHNSREWFQEHKKEYQQLVIAPLQELVRRLTPVMLEIDREVTTEPRVDRTISRIWRDTRYSHDKSFYRDNMWIIFKRGKMHGTQVPGLHFELTQSGFNYGCGFYHASPAYMERLRAQLLAAAPPARQALERYQSQSCFVLEGDRYARPHFPEQPEALQEWLERRNIGFCCESSDAGLLFSDRLADKLAEDFRLLAPIYRFLLYVA
ncbi:MAG: DUF2461 domain-containing protein [Provencibacterium sp.]|jgi:uncharacterized protein (TIGR02453 family)|nr:DUF2461 domain-containing protein [Provencibacterium sp.]